MRTVFFFFFISRFPRILRVSVLNSHGHRWPKKLFSDCNTGRARYVRRTEFANKSICATGKSGLHNANSLRLSGVRAGCDTKCPCEFRGEEINANARGKFLIYSSGFALKRALSQDIL